MAGLFDDNPAVQQTSQPLATRMRPRTLDEFVGQEQIVGDDSILRQAIKSDEIPSMIFWGPPGCGKSTLAAIIANSTKHFFENFSAVTSGIPEMRKVIERANERKRANGRDTILFVDEIHRVNKAQQDALLPHVEKGTVTLIGATTENPYFEVNSPLISRSRIMRFESLTSQQVKELLKRALVDSERGLGGENADMDEEALDHIVGISEGDVRSALNALELAVRSAPKGETDGRRHVTLDLAEQAVQKRAFKYDKDGDSHYDTISAFIKSMRGSDPDAAVYWLARMLNAGEDPKFIARRIVIQAAEDVGNADPMALVVAMAAAQAVQFVGLPECQIPLSQAVIYLACAPKSNACYTAINRANQDVANRKWPPVPRHLRDTSYPGAKKLGHGEGYKYPHAFPGGFVEQEYKPAEASSTVYYEPTDRGHEAKFKQRLERLKGVARMNAVTVGDTVVRAVLGDITQQDTDAIVNAANNSLLGGGGVDGAIHSAGGPAILEESSKLGGCETGDAKITGGGNLKAKHVIHAVGPVYVDGNSGERELLAKAYRRSLEVAVENGIKTISFPAISAGAYHYPLEEAAEVAVSVVGEFAQKHEGLGEVRFVLFSPEALGVYLKAMEAHLV